MRRRDCIVFAVLVVLLGLPWTGTLSAQQPVPFDRVDLPVSLQPRALAVGDFNRDGKLDLAVAHAGSSTLAILLGNGNRTFQAPRMLEVGSGVTALAVADFNRDGKPDLAIVNPVDSTVSVLLGNGDGSFRPPQVVSAGLKPVALVVADFNLDGDADLAVVQQASNSVSILLGNGHGGFQSSQTLWVGNNPVAVAVGDFNSDGIPDLAVAAQGWPPVCTPTDDWEQPEWIVGDGFPRRRRNVSRGECDESTAGSASVFIFLGNGDGSFGPAQVVPMETQAASLAVGRFNPTGNADLVMANPATNTVSILFGNGDGSFQPVQAMPGGALPVSALAADIDGDGLQDLVVANQGSNTVSILLGNGNGTFRPAREFGVEIGPAALAVGDFDRNGLLDVVAANQVSNNVSILLGNRCATCWSHAEAAEPMEVLPMAWPAVPPAGRRLTPRDLELNGMGRLYRQDLQRVHSNETHGRRGRTIR